MLSGTWNYANTLVPESGAHVFELVVNISFADVYCIIAKGTPDL